MLYANLVALSFIEPELWAIEVLHCGHGDFLLFVCPMQFMALDRYKIT